VLCRLQELSAHMTKSTYPSFLEKT